MHNFAGDEIKELLRYYDKSIHDLARQTEISPTVWGRVISGGCRISVDLAIRLGKVFPLVDYKGTVPLRAYVSKAAWWLNLQFQSDLMNSTEHENDIIYRNIKPIKRFEEN